MEGATPQPGVGATTPERASTSGDLLGPFSASPPLTMLAMAASVASLALNRVVIRTLGSNVPHDLTVWLDRWFALTRNLAAIAGVVALTGGLYDILRRRGVAALPWRVVVAGFAGVFLPTTVLATVFPQERTTPALVLFGTGAASVLAVMVGLVTARWRGPVGLRAGVGLAAASVFFALGALVGRTVLPSQLWELGIYFGKTMNVLGETTYLLAPLAVVPSIRPLYPPRRAELGRVVGIVVGLGVMALFAWGRQAMAAETFGTILYGAQRLSLLVETAPLVYSLPLAVGFGIGAAALTSAAPADRQAGAGLLLLLSGGYAPQTPAQLMMMVLGITLLGRTLVAQAVAIRQSREGAEP